jgi:cyclophilin family peptidyl-prolyl cis-trans isomerase/HEAT repeat protein
VIYHPSTMPRRLLTVLLLYMTLAACASAPPSSDLPVLAVPDLEERALLLLLVDRQMYEPFAVQRALAGSPELREELAVALGRIPDRQGRQPLIGLLLDDVPAVRRAAAFALGELEDPEAKDALLQAVRDPDREAGLLAVEALGKLKTPVVEVAESLLPLPEEERTARLIPSLFRFREERMVTLAEGGLALADRELHARSAYALAREPFPQAVPTLRRLLADPDTRVRGWAARGLGLAGGGEDLAALRPLLDDREPGPVIQALRAARALLTGGKGTPPVPPGDWVPRLLELIAAPHPGVRVTALEAAGAWPLAASEASSLGEALAQRAAEGQGRERGVALVALATGRHPQAARLTADAAAADDPDVRARAAEAAGLLGASGILDRLAGDPTPEVRTVAVETRLTTEQDPARASRLASEGLKDADPGVLATVFGWLADHPVLPMSALAGALQHERQGSEETVVAGLGALVARAEAEAGERATAVALLEKAEAGGGYVLRREAGAALGTLGQPVPRLRPVETGKDLDDYREIVQQTRQPRDVEIRTSKGTIRVRLACPQAPLTCLNFLQLAAQGFFNGLGFHRVVPDFVIQGGDPRGDGSGGPGYDIRDEINRLRYRRGAVGMALSGPDTGGSQFFLTLSEQPHLDGGYTLFGQVTAGDDILDRIVADDRIEAIVEVR